MKAERKTKVSSPTKVVKVKGFAILCDGVLTDKFIAYDSCFSPRIYKTAESARNVARKLPAEKDIEVVECLITYQPIRTSKRK